MDARGKIKVLNGAHEYKQFADELVRVYRLAGKRHLELNLPVLIMRTGNGQGNTTYLHLLAELLQEEKILTFSGEEEVFEWRILEADQDPVQRLMLRMECAAGFYPYFSGVIGLDLSDISDPESLGSNLFALIRENRSRIMFCLMVPENRKPGFLKKLEEHLRLYTQVKTIRVNASERDKCRFVRNELIRRGFLLGTNLEDALRMFVTSAGDTGYRGLHLAIEEIIWRKMERNDGMLIDAADFQNVCFPDEKEMYANRKRVIGFGEHEL